MSNRVCFMGIFNLKIESKVVLINLKIKMKKIFKRLNLKKTKQNN